MYLKFEDILTDERARTALQRLYTVSSMEEMGLSEVILEKPRELLKKSMDELGGQFAQLVAFYDEFKAYEDARSKQFMDWQGKCLACKFSGGDALATDGEMWCEKYRAMDRTYPDPCPTFEPKDDGEMK